MSGFIKRYLYIPLAPRSVVNMIFSEIIEASDAECKTEILTNKKYLETIDAKLEVGLAEYHKYQNTFCIS